MNKSLQIFLINSKTRAIETEYEPGDKSTRVFKSLDAGIEVDDFVVVQTSTRHNMTVVKVVAVDVDVDFDDKTVMQWVVSKVPVEDFEALVAQESKALETISKAEKFRRRETLRKDLLADTESEVMALPIYDDGVSPNTDKGGPSKE